MDYMSTDFGVDSSSRFPFRARTNRQTRLSALPNVGGYRPIAGVGKKVFKQMLLPLPITGMTEMK